MYEVPVPLPLTALLLLQIIAEKNGSFYSLPKKDKEGINLRRMRARLVLFQKIEFSIL